MKTGVGQKSPSSSCGSRRVSKITLMFFPHCKPPSPSMIFLSSQSEQMSKEQQAPAWRPLTLSESSSNGFNLRLSLRQSCGQRTPRTTLEDLTDLISLAEWRGDLVLPHQLPKCPSVLVRRSRRSRDIPVVSQK